MTKRRVSAFAGSDLDVVLRAGANRRPRPVRDLHERRRPVDPARQAADLDFGLTVLRDACADADDEVHRVLTEKVFPRQAEVIDVAAWTAGARRRRCAA